MEIGNQIRKYRTSLNLSQDELADRIYVTRQTISNWENNRNYPDIRSLVLLSNVFGVSNGDNVIVIMLESLEWYPFTDGTENSYTFSNELTPNIYNLIQDGFIATDFFAKSKTNISEGIGFLGSYPIGKYMEQVTGKKQLDNYGFSMPNVLNKLGYTTCYLHSNVGSYYSRKSTHKYLGFSNSNFKDHKYCNMLASKSFKSFP